MLPNNYANPDLDKQVLGDVVDIFTNMDMGDTEHSQDLLGRTYEYCIAQFASVEGKGGGEFYTPASVVKTLVSILKPFSNCRVYENCTTSLIRIQAAWTEGSFLGLGGLVRAFLSFDYTEQKKTPPNRCGSEAPLRL